MYAGSLLRDFVISLDDLEIEAQKKKKRKKKKNNAFQLNTTSCF